MIFFEIDFSTNLGERACTLMNMRILWRGVVRKVEV